MSLAKFQEALIAEFNNCDDEQTKLILEFVDGYIQEDRKQYKEQKKNKQLTFGKYKGYSVKELSLTMKGKDYLRWLLTQTWCTDTSSVTFTKSVSCITSKPKKRSVWTNFQFH